VCLATCVASLTPRAAQAQIFETIGIRAQGMGGAFVAVADDATATWWNPAGLATGAYFSGLVEYDRLTAPADTSVEAVAVGYPALGLSYYRLPISEMQPASSVATASSGRQDQGYLSEFGATVGQSLGKQLAVSSTLKLVRAGETHGDFDVGTMATLGHFRIGVVVRNVTQPSFGPAANHLVLDRQARVGGAFILGSSSSNQLVIAVDGDLTRVPTYAGDSRRVAGGAELWVWRRLLGVRGGLSAETVAQHASASGGLSFVLQSGRYLKTYLDGQLTRGTDEVRRGWGTDVRVTF